MRQERLQVVRAAGEIILEDIRSKVFDTSTYPPNYKFLGGVPKNTDFAATHPHFSRKEGLIRYVEEEMPYFGPCNHDSRPTLIVPIVHHGLYRCLHIYKVLIQTSTLSSLGFSASYEEASRLEGSYVLQAIRAKIKESADQFTQFTLDNADFNVNTLDGKNTFHVVGATMVVTPK